MKTDGRKMTPAKSSRARCLDCCGGEPGLVRSCEVSDCALHEIRMGRGMKGKGGCLKRIRAYCLRCMNGQAGEVRQCQTTTCPIHPYRMGRRPKATPSVLENRIVGGPSAFDLPRRRGRVAGSHQNAPELPLWNPARQTTNGAA